MVGNYTSPLDPMGFNGYTSTFKECCFLRGFLYHTLGCGLSPSQYYWQAKVYNIGVPKL